MALLRDTSLLSRLIATLALLSAAESFMLVVWNNQLSQPDSFLPTRNPRSSAPFASARTV